MSLANSRRLPVTLDDVLLARERIHRSVHRTPVLTSRTLDERCGCRVFLKAEVFQRVGAFKIRGAFSRLTLLSSGERRRGVVAFSSGNHAQAVALAARELGIPATIVMPNDAPEMKVAATRGYGATVVTYTRKAAPGEEDSTSLTREEIAARIVEETGASLVPPFDHPDVIAGQGTLGLEFLEDVPGLDAVVAPCGGGGLLSGIAVAMKSRKPSLAVFGVEPEAGNDVQRSLACKEPVSIPVPQTIADCLQTTRAGDYTFAILKELASGILTVSDEDLIEALVFLVSRLKVVAEPGGAAGLAALLTGKVPVPAGSSVGVVLSGGNVDPAALSTLLARGVSHVSGPSRSQRT